MSRTITVKGVGKASAKPDYVVLSMSLESRNLDYEKAMDIASENIQYLTHLLSKVGYAKDELKTTAFNVRTVYDRRKDNRGEYQSVFAGFEVSHDLKLGFDFDVMRLSQTLTAISLSTAKPRMSVSFTVKDATAVNEELLRSATANARRKAEILCEASGVVLGPLETIHYNWGEISLYSRTDYDCDDCFCALSEPMAKAVEITPDDIDVSDSATFVWKIRDPL